MNKGRYLFPAILLIFTCTAFAWGKKKLSAPVIYSNSTDFFRSAQTGDWGTLSTWESSPDNSSWSAATLIPTSAANTISIRNGHIVTVITNQDMDQVIINSGGNLIHSGGTLTLNDDASGDDIIVQSGGIFTLAINPSVTFSGSATANINTAGMLRLSASGLMVAGTGVHVSNYIYQHASILEYTLSTLFSTDNVTVFPNVNAVTIPIFRITGNVGAVGANTTTTINGLFEANGNITFQNSGTKIFRNGITGTGNVTASSSPLSGKFVINGTTASLGGSGSLILNSNGMDIGNSTTVTMVSNKSITGNIALLSNALVMLGAYNLTMTGDISGGSSTSHIVTNGTGKLVLNNIVAAPRIFPIGANTTTINPLAISNGEGFNYGARVETGLNPGIGIQFKAVNRTWTVRPSATPAGTVNVNFFYAAADVNGGFSFPPATVELGFYTGVWNVINTGLTQFGSYQVTGTVTSQFLANTDAPMAIGNIGAILAANDPVSINYFKGIKQNGRHILSWELACSNTTAVNIELQRSSDAFNYSSIYNTASTAQQCLQSTGHTDAQPLPGINYYRLKITDAAGKIMYGQVVHLRNADKGFDVLNIAPNPVVNGNFKLGISAAQNALMEIVVTDMQGRRMLQQNYNAVAGFNAVPLHVEGFSAGMYQVYVNTAEGRSKILRFVMR